MIHSQGGKSTLMIAPQSATGGATVTASLDTDDADYVVLHIAFNSETNTNAEDAIVSVLHDDTTVISNAVTVAANVSADRTAARTVKYHIDKRGKERYIFVQINPGTSASTNGNAIFSVIGETFRNDTGPSGTTGMAHQAVVA